MTNLHAIGCSKYIFSRPKQLICLENAFQFLLFFSWWHKTLSTQSLEFRILIPHFLNNISLPSKLPSALSWSARNDHTQDLEAIWPTSLGIAFVCLSFEPSLMMLFGHLRCYLYPVKRKRKDVARIAKISIVIYYSYSSGFALKKYLISTFF